MQLLNWSPEKNSRLKEERGISFEDVEMALIEDRVLADMAHPNKEKFPHQRMLIVELENYAYVVPYVFEDEDTFFLKTIYPSRAMTKHYLRKNDE